VSIAQRLTAQAGPDDLVGRLGGDEFVLLHRRVTSEEEVVRLAERLCAAAREPVVLYGVTLTVGCSIGIALAPDHAHSFADLLRCADVALYAAKATRGTACVYDKMGDRHSPALLGLQADLRAALENEADTQFWVAYQPQLDLRSGKIVSVECLARWRHPVLGELPPDVFIPIAESTTLIDMLLHRILDVSLRQLAAWEDIGLYLTASVNVSARHLSDMSLPQVIGQRLRRNGLSADRLVLEVTESRLMADPEHSAHVLRQLHEQGLQISIDDFGTGYSSLTYLQRLAADELKIDKTFTAELGISGNATIIRSTIELGHNLGLRVVAEGVEDQETADQLASFGCDLLQGYFISRPVPASNIPLFLAAAAPVVPPRLTGSAHHTPDKTHGPKLVPAHQRRKHRPGELVLEKAE
jgi:predicted signal transduction protein with EAL and GGDEF domain